MKWLLLLALISCGKHKEPEKLDLYDSDGDQVLNYEESELEKYVADYEPLGKVKGVIKLNLEGLVEIPFSNELDLNQTSLSLIVSNEERLKTEDYFDEWSRLRLLQKIPVPELKSTLYSIHIHFENGSDMAEELVLSNEKGSLSLGHWQQVMKIQISRENLEDILKGKAFFNLKKGFRKSPLFQEQQDGTIREKTYRVHFSEGSKGKVLYVANSLTFSELLEKMNIRGRTITEDEIFFDTQLGETDQWYVRELKSGDKVVVYTNREQLRKKFFENYIYKKEILSRVNGLAASEFHFKNPDGAKIYVKVSSARFTERTFVESRKKRRHGTGGGGGREGNAGSVKCTHYYRNISKESHFPAELQDVFRNISQEELLVNAHVEEELDGTGVYWEMKLNGPEPDLKWSFSNRPSSTYTLTGEYKNSCESMKGTAYKTNNEGKFEIVVESFVEKLAE